MSPVSDPGFFRPFNLALLACLVLLLTSLSMIAVWAAVGRSPWYLRVGVLLGVVALLHWPGAHEPATYLLIHGFLLALVVVIWRSGVWRLLTTRKFAFSSWKFRLRDMLLWMAVAAGTLWAVQRALLLLRGRALDEVIMTAIAATAAVMPIVWLVLAARGWARLAALALALLGGCWLGFVWNESDWFHPHEASLWPLSIDRGSTAKSFVVVAIVQGFLLVWLLFWQSGRRKTSPSPIDRLEGTSRRTSLGGIFAATMFALIALPIVYLFASMSMPKPIGQDLPTPNAWGDLCSIVEQLDANPQSTSAIATAREMVRREWAYPVAEHAYKGDALHDPFDVTWTLQTTFFTMSETMIAQSDYDAAADYALAEVEVTHGATTAVDFDVVSYGGQGRSLHRIALLAPELSPEMRQQLLKRLLEIDADRVELDELDRRYWEYTPLLSAHWADWKYRFAIGVRETLGVMRDRDATWHVCVRDARLRMTLVALAACEFEQDHGRYPREIGELVPAYLPRVPVDPFSGKPIIYRQTADGYLVYSVGPNGIDDGGVSEPDDYMKDYLSLRPRE